MKIAKHAFKPVLAGLFTAFGVMAHAETVTKTMRRASSDLSNLPLVVLGLSAIVVYLCNRPRNAVCARARRRTESSRGTPH
jgi:hypothetical protein